MRWEESLLMQYQLKFKEQISGMKIFLLYISCLSSFFAFSQDKSPLFYQIPINQVDIDSFPERQQIVIITGDSILNVVAKCVNVECVIFLNTSQVEIPNYFSEFKKLKSILFDGVKKLPIGLEQLSYITDVDILNCANVDFSSYINAHNKFSQIKIFNSKKLHIDTLSSIIVLLKEMHANLNGNKFLYVMNCDEFMLLESKFNLYKYIAFVSNVREFKVAYCQGVLINDSLIKKMKNIENFIVVK